MAKILRGILCIVLVLTVFVSCKIFNSDGGREILYQGVGKVIVPSTERFKRNSEADIIKLNNGDLLLVYTKFLGYKDDHKAFLAGKKSSDNGRTWSNEYIFQENIGKINTMSPSFVRIDSSLIGFFFIVKHSNQNSQIFFSKSSDEGISWSMPQKITKGKKYHILNNDRVLQLNSGRLLIPVASTSDIDSSYGEQVISIYYSDDEGRSWEHNNTMVQFENGPAMEPGIAQAKDGSLIMVIRTQFDKIYFSRSFDNGITWTKPKRSNLNSPASPATLKRIPNTDKLILIWNKNSGGVWSRHSRTPLNITISSDGGKTWEQDIKLEQDLSSIFAYTSITFLQREILFTYYHSSMKDPQYYNLVFKKVSKETLFNKFKSSD